MAGWFSFNQGGLGPTEQWTKWRIAYDYLPTTRLWLKGSGISVAAQPHDTSWPYTRPINKQAKASAPVHHRASHRNPPKALPPISVANGQTGIPRRRC